MSRQHQIAVQDPAGSTMLNGGALSALDWRGSSLWLKSKLRWQPAFVRFARII